jgi:hypothetical protein
LRYCIATELTAYGADAAQVQQQPNTARPSESSSSWFWDTPEESESEVEDIIDSQSFNSSENILHDNSKINHYEPQHCTATKNQPLE